MRITILETGRPPQALRGAHPDYPAMFERLLRAVDPDLTFETVPVIDGLPAPPAAEAVLITGSSAGAYEDHGWIAPLENAIRAYAAAAIPQVGICFGHQIMAQALGGKVEKSPKGWGVGRHAYDLLEAPPFFDPPSARFALAASHQDQVSQKPQGAVTLAASAHTEFAALHYPAARALSFQGHPEMDDAFTAALYDGRRASLTDAMADNAIASLKQPSDSALVARWIVSFLRANPI